MNQVNPFKKATRQKVRLKIALTGPSGSGKTYSALSIAAGIGKRVALIDTENFSASLYGDRFEFDTLTLDPPYTIEKYTRAIEAAVQAGYDVLVIDSITHAWAGDGGLLSKKEAMDARGGNSYTNWAGITKEHEAFKGKLLNCDVHLICTMRSKQDYVLETNDKGKQAPRKVGMAPIQRDGMEYEFTTVLDLAMDHNAAASKDRTGLFDGKLFKPSAATGKVLMDWLDEAAPLESRPELPVAAPKPNAHSALSTPIESAPQKSPVVAPKATAAETKPVDEGRQLLLGMVKSLKGAFLIAEPTADMTSILRQRYGKEGTSGLSNENLRDLVKLMKTKINEAAEFEKNANEADV